MAALVVAAAGCGGEDSDDEAATTTQTATEASNTGAAFDSGDQSGEAEAAASGEQDAQAEPVKRTGPPPTVKGGDNSIQRFGEEADPRSFDEIAGLVVAFMRARADRDWERACNLLSPEIDEQLQEAAERMEGLEISCERFVEHGAKVLSARQLERMADIRVGSVRVKGDRGFVIFRDGRGAWQFMPVSRDGESWDLAAIGPTPLQV